MPEQPPFPRSHQQWAHFRFSVIGPLLAAPPERGQLQAQLDQLASQTWRHPITGQGVRWGRSTIERWYYAALSAKQDPVAALRRKVRSDAGQHPSLSLRLGELLATQHRQHPHWSYQLHADNLAVLLEPQPDLGPPPSYASVRRFLQAHGLFKRLRRGPRHSPGAQAAEHRFEQREVRSYQCAYVNGLWHLDFHHGSVRVLLERGQYAYPLLLGILDDRSRLGCHAQGYLAEGAEELGHGLGQGFQKRALPRALMTDNGSAMLAAETVQGLARLGIVHETTLPYSPYQNGKQEAFWGQVEGRLLPMLEDVPDLSLRQLNEATLAWLEMEYNRKPHSELGQSPVQAYLQVPDVGRPCPSSQDLERAFTAEVRRTVRRSDGTISLGGIRFEIPSRYSHFPWVTVRSASWDLSTVHLTDPKTGAFLARLFPQDKQRNADGQRARRAGAPDTPAAPPQTLAPLLQKLLKDYAPTGLPPAYLPKDEITPKPA
jgi:transposase InsO family protein